MLDLLVSIGELSCNSYVLTLTSVFGIVFNSDSGEDFFREYWDFVMMLAIIHQKYEIAIRATYRLEQEGYDKKRILILRNIIRSLENSLSKDECIALLYKLNKDKAVLNDINRLYTIKEKGIPHIGGECEKCYFKMICCKEKYDTIMSYFPKCNLPK